MRFLANENFPGDAVEALRNQGHDVTWIRTDAPGIADAEVLNRAQRDERILLTFDKDFGELAFHSHLPATCGIILFRIKSPSGTVVAQKVATAIASRPDWAGHFSVVEDERIRMRVL
jgi:predicted nuclease of predicted toxin-antitoxin system